MKKTVEMLKKLLICMLILLILNNFFIGNFSPIFVYAGEPGVATSDPDPNSGNGKNFIRDTLEKLLGTVVGLFTWPIRLVAMAIGFGVSSLMGVVANITDTNNNGSSGSDITLSPDDVLFNTDSNNNIQLLNINFFKIDNLNQGSVLYKFRAGIAFWYYAMRNIAAAILLCILIYVGIRMALSTVSAQQKASYKKMLVDWVVSLAIIFVLQYIILFTIYVNNAIVDAIRNVASVKSFSDFIDNMGKEALRSEYRGHFSNNNILYACISNFWTFYIIF